MGKKREEAATKVFAITSGGRVIRGMCQLAFLNGDHFLPEMNVFSCKLTVHPGIIMNSTAKQASSKATANISVCSIDYERNSLSSNFLT